MATKASKRDPDTYESHDPNRPTSYDTSQPETDTPQEIREGSESPAMQVREEEVRTGKSSVTGTEGTATSS
jgi:hypothetical protein